jgi:hypothetical protein
LTGREVKDWKDQGTYLQIRRAPPNILAKSRANKIKTHETTHTFFYSLFQKDDRLCSLVVRVTGYTSRSLGSILDATRFSEKQLVWKGVHSASWAQLKSYLEKKVAAPV